MILRLIVFAIVLWLIYLMIRRASDFLSGELNTQKKDGSESDIKVINIDDPFQHISHRPAAISVMIAFARLEGEMSGAARERIFNIMEEYFDLRGEKADDMYYSAARLLTKVDDIGHLLSNLSPVINSNCSYIEKKQLLDMLKKIGTTDKKEMSSTEKELLKTFSEYLKIGPDFVNAPPV